MGQTGFNPPKGPGPKDHDTERCVFLYHTSGKPLMPTTPDDFSHRSTRSLTRLGLIMARGSWHCAFLLWHSWMCFQGALQVGVHSCADPVPQVRQIPQVRRGGRGGHLAARGVPAGAHAAAGEGEAAEPETKQATGTYNPRLINMGW